MKKIISYLKTKDKILLIILLVGVIVFVGQRLVKEDESETEIQEYTITSVERGTIANSVSATGLIETANYLSVTTSVNGIVKEVFVNEGDTVVEGQPIMEITLNSDGEESYLSAQSSYVAAKNTLDSAKASLISSDSSLINAEEDFEDEKEDNSYQSHDEKVSYALAENSYELAQANYNNQLEVINQKQVALSKAWLSYQAQSPIILAPDSGVVANIVVVEGMDISNSLSERTSSSVASIKKEGTPIASLSVSELDINNVSVGQETRITLTSNSEEEIIGKVVGIDKIGEYSGGVTNYTVIVKFNDDYDKALPGMGVDAEIIASEQTDVLSIPVSAVTTKKGESFVTKVINGEDIQASVELGTSDGSNIEVISGLSEGDQIKVGALPTTGFSDTKEQENVRIPGMGSGMGGAR